MPGVQYPKLWHRPHFPGLLGSASTPETDRASSGLSWILARPPGPRSCLDPADAGYPAHRPQNLGQAVIRQTSNAPAASLPQHLPGQDFTAAISSIQGCSLR